MDPFVVYFSAAKLNDNELESFWPIGPGGQPKGNDSGQAGQDGSCGQGGLAKVCQHRWTLVPPAAAGGAAERKVERWPWRTWHFPPWQGAIYPAWLLAYGNMATQPLHIPLPSKGEQKYRSKHQMAMKLAKWSA